MSHHSVFFFFVENLATLTFTRINKVIPYSSVAHIGIVIGGLITLLWFIYINNCSKFMLLYIVLFSFNKRIPFRGSKW